MRRDQDRIRDRRPADRPPGHRADTGRPGRRHGPRRQDDLLAALRVSGNPAGVPVPGVTSCIYTAAKCQLVASTTPSYARQPVRRVGTDGEIDLVRSGFGYRWVRGPSGTQLLRPPTTVPCAPSLQSAYIDLSARWHSGKHTVRVLRGGRQVGRILTPSLGHGVHLAEPRLERCGSRARFTYLVTTGHRTQRVSFTVLRR